MEMLFWHPLSGLSNTTLTWLLLLFGGGAVLCLIRADALSRRLRTSLAPQGVVSLEMSLSAEESRQIIGSWSPEARQDARQQLICDYWFIPLFTTALAIVGLFAAHWFADKGWPWMSALAMALVWGQWLVGLFDFAENSALLRMLQTYPEVPNGMARLVAFCARMKFLVIMLCVFLTLFAVMTWAF